MTTGLLDGTAAIVTGASRGIGAATCVALARAGANVGLISRDSSALDALARHIKMESGGFVAFRAADVSNSDLLTRAINELIGEVGTPTLLVNNAGTIERSAPEDAKPSSWYRVLDTNLGSALAAATAVLPYMKAEGFGSIVNVTSLSAHFGVRGAVSYGASKSGLLGLTRALALDWAEYGVRVNAVTPGYVGTELTEPLTSNPARAGRILERIPLGRWGQPEDVSGTIVYLGSPLSAYVTGQVIVVDGGYSVNG